MDRIKLIIIGGLVLLSSISIAQKPKLVVGIVVDQMRYDYINKYWDTFGEGGFKRLVNEGYSCKNTHYNYVPTYTGPGHASIYTGTTPATNGIISNNWYDKKSGKIIYCVDDSTATTIGSNSINGKKSSHLNLATTFTDELKLSNKNSKVISISLKDRGAVLPAGHLPNGAFWYDNASGNWISSSAFTTKLPKWVSDYNAKNRAKELLSQPWNTLLPISKYTVSEPDQNNYEGTLEGEDTPIFPHDLKAIFDASNSKNWSLLKFTPFGNTLTQELAVEAIKAEQLGKDDAADILAVSFSATDYIGHRFGPQSIEHQDVYLRLDKDIELLLVALDKEVGKDNYVVFLTADHGAVRVPNLLLDNNIPAGYFNRTDIVLHTNAFLSRYYGSGNWVANFSNYQFFLNKELIEEKNQEIFHYNSDNNMPSKREYLNNNGISIQKMEKLIVQYAMTLDGVSNAYTSSDLITGKGGKPISLMQLGYNQKRSGNVAIALSPGWVSYGEKGTTHGSAYTYDTHVPLLWYGAGIKKGSTAKKLFVTDIASTVCILLDISFPNGNIGKPISQIVD